MIAENKKELIKKITAVVVLGMLFGFVWAFYLKSPVENKPQLVKTLKTTAPPSSLSHNEAVENSFEQDKPEQKPQEQVVQRVFTPSFIHSSNKSQLIKLAAQNIGKKDPFVNNNLKSKNPPSLNFPLSNNNLLLSKSTTNVLPSTDNLLNLPNFQTNFQATTLYDEPVLKGFIGNKAIISYKGSIKALVPNQSFEDIKITSIIANNFSIEYVQKGKKHFKQLKVSENGKLGIIK